MTLSSFLGLCSLTVGSFVLALVSLIYNIILIIVYIIHYNAADLTTGKQITLILLMIVLAITALLGLVVLFGLKAEKSGLILASIYGHAAMTLASTILIIILIFIYSWWFLVEIIASAIYVYAIMVFHGVYKEMTSSSFQH